MAQTTPPKINTQKFSRRLGRLKYMKKFYENKLEQCEEKQRGLFEDLISALNYSISLMTQAKEFSDHWYSEANAEVRLLVETNTPEAEEAPVEEQSITDKHRKDLEELDDTDE